MSRMLSELLGADEPLFSVSLQQLERGSGNMGVDVRLTAQIIHKIHQKTRELGLDPRDTTGRELYAALKTLVKRHDGFLATRLGVSDPTDVQQVLQALPAFISTLPVNKSAWVLKHSVAKRLLKACPPKKVMKQLKYRSIDSMLKREPVGAIYGALRFSESSAWQEAFMKKYESLKPSDFETRDIEIIVLDKKRWQPITDEFVGQNRHNITHLKELGVILVLPLPVKHMHGITITTLTLLLHYLAEIRLYSSFFKLQQVNSDFGRLLASTLLDDPDDHALMAGHRVHWRTIHRHFGQAHHKHAELFEPHVALEDLLWRKTEETLYRIEPALHFWHDMEFVAVMHDGRPVSFNLMDMAVNYVNNVTYGYQSTHFFTEALRNEINVRYLGQPALESQVASQLVHGADIEMETFSVEGVF